MEDLEDDLAFDFSYILLMGTGTSRGGGLGEGARVLNDSEDCVRSLGRETEPRLVSVVLRCNREGVLTRLRSDGEPGVIGGKGEFGLADLVGRLIRRFRSIADGDGVLAYTEPGRGE